MVISSSWYDHISILLGRQDKIIKGGLHKPPVLIISSKNRVKKGNDIRVYLNDGMHIYTYLCGIFGLSTMIKGGNGGMIGEELETTMIYLCSVMGIRRL